MELDTADSFGFEVPGDGKFVRWPISFPGTVSFGRLIDGKLTWEQMKLARQANPQPTLPTLPAASPFARPGTRTLISERIVPNSPLPPSEVRVTNTHTQDLIVGYVELTKKPIKPREHAIAPGKTKPICSNATQSVSSNCLKS